MKEIILTDIYYASHRPVWGSVLYKTISVSTEEALLAHYVETQSPTKSRKVFSFHITSANKSVMRANNMIYDCY